MNNDSVSSTRSLSGRRFGRVLPPAAAAASPLDILRRLHESKQHSSADLLTDALWSLYPSAGIRYFGSGTEALSALLKAVGMRSGRRFVLVGGYTCPDVVTAVLSAGLEPVVLDMQPGTLSALPDTSPVSPSEAAAVVLSNLYGRPEDIRPWQELASRDGIVIVDDACQSAFSTDGTGRVGARANFPGVLSFGRGKALAGVGGGAVILPSGVLSGELSAKLGAEIAAGVTSAVRDTAYGLALWLFSKPAFYGIPSAIPGLGIGETRCRISAERKPFSPVARAYALSIARRAEEWSDMALARCELWRIFLSDAGAFDVFANDLEAGKPLWVPTRYPVIIPNPGARERILGRARRYGVSGSYPKALADFPELAGKLKLGSSDGARKLAAHVLTLPVHADVTPEDQEQVIEIIREELRR